MHNSIRTIPISIGLIIALGGCASKSTMVDGDGSPTTENSATTSGSGEEATIISMGLDETMDGSDSVLGDSDESVAVASGVEEAAEGVDATLESVIYFNFDEAIVSEEAQVVIKRHANTLLEFPDVKLSLSGHADERGTREYNLALGDQRAQAVSRYFQHFGIEKGRITAMSYGEEQPVALESNEEAWRLNRRVEILHDMMK